MNICLANALIIDPSSGLHLRRANVFIEEGIIKSITDRPPTSSITTIESNNLCVSPGWMDMYADLGYPGGEHRETLRSGTRAAAAGGFTALGINPATKPIIDHHSLVAQLVSYNAEMPVELFPIGAVNPKFNQSDLADMMDMHTHGAIAFSNGYNPISDSGVLYRAMLYNKPWNGLIIDMPDDQALSMGGQINEGVVNVELGLKGKPAIAEELFVRRDAEIAAYSMGRIHLIQVSCANSLAIIEQSKQKNNLLTASVSPYHLIYTDEDCRTFDTNYKTQLPLRTASDRAALWKGLVSGTIDAITSCHQPQDIDSKNCEFDEAAPGMNLMEIVFPLLNTFSNGSNTIELHQWVEWLCMNPRKIVGLPIPKIEEGAMANITLFDPERQWEFNRNNMKSISRNCPIEKTIFKGKIIGTVLGNKVNIEA